MSTCPCDYLEKKYPFEREKRIVFDDSIGPDGERRHDYYIDGDKENIKSVTTIIHENFQHFDSEAIVNKIISGKKHSQDPTYKYYGMTKKDILDSWERNRVDASTRGTAMHLHIEQFLNHYPFEDDTKEFKQFMEFYEDYPHLEPFRTELIVFDDHYRLAGSIDMLYRDRETGNLWIYDWKRSKEFRYSNRYQRGKGELRHMDDCNINHYTLQLNMYKHILELHYGVKVQGMCLVRCHPNLDTYDRVQVRELPNEINAILSRREIELYGADSNKLRAKPKPKKPSPKRYKKPAFDECTFSDSDEE